MKQLNGHAIYAAHEAIQVAAMAQKALDSKMQPWKRQSLWKRAFSFAKILEKVFKKLLTL